MHLWLLWLSKGMWLLSGNPSKFFRHWSHAWETFREEQNWGLHYMSWVRQPCLGDLHLSVRNKTEATLHELGVRQPCLGDLHLSWGTKLRLHYHELGVRQLCLGDLPSVMRSKTEATLHELGVRQPCQVELCLCHENTQNWGATLNSWRSDLYSMYYYYVHKYNR